jgi:DAACS family dicarboxylate/amino acid:cation (Na+ or H+) symporter/aerobic C4-dicarboxylate transport protein
LLILGVMMLTSKGSAGVAGAGFVALAATLASMHKIPVSGLVLLLGVDRFLNEARAITNLIGNGVATIAIARWEGALDMKKAEQVLADPVAALQFVDGVSKEGSPRQVKLKESGSRAAENAG